VFENSDNGVLVATGVQVVSSGNRFILSAEKEVILAAGAIAID
jgi:hypothetical protein